jgi:hypothetical protein
MVALRYAENEGEDREPRWEDGVADARSTGRDEGGPVPRRTSARTWVVADLTFTLFGGEAIL